MTVDFNYPYTIDQDTPATAIEVQGNFDQLLSWIKTEYRQKDDTPNMTVRMIIPADGGASNPQHAVSKAELDATLPTGMIVQYGGNVAPTGWLLCDGTAYATAGQYNQLYNIIGTQYGDGGGGNNFQVPNMVGKFARGAANPADLTETGGDDDGVASHSHTASANNDTHSHTVDAHDHGAGTFTVDIDHGHSWSGSVNQGSRDIHDLREIISNGGWPDTDAGGDNGLLYGGTGFFDHFHPATPNNTGNWAPPSLPRLGSDGTFNSIWNAEEVSLSVSGSVTSLNQANEPVVGSSGDRSPGTDSDTHSHSITVDSDGTSGGNVPAYIAMNYIIKT